MAKTIIIGAGASGLMAALSASKYGNEVIVLEHRDNPGRKLLITGNGKCNLGNMVYNRDFFHCHEKEFPYYALEKINIEFILEFLSYYGLHVKVKNGYLYPMSECASDMVKLLVNSCKEQGVLFMYNTEVKKIIPGENSIVVEYIKDGVRTKIQGDNVIVAAGGRAYSKTGSDGSGYYFAKTLGHNVIEPLPALAGLIVEDENVKKMAGVRADVCIRTYVKTQNGEKLMGSDNGQIQITAYGLSGIPAFQLSSVIARNLHKNKSVYCTVDFLPDISTEELKEYILEICKRFPERNAYNLFLTMLNDKISNEILHYSQVKKELKFKDIINDYCIIDKIIKNTKSMKYEIKGVNDFDNAQVCSGGVDTNEINNRTFESKIVHDVYFTGELLDVDGICGGYNLHWAWASGYLAGISCAEGKK